MTIFQKVQGRITLTVEEIDDDGQISETVHLVVPVMFPADPDALEAWADAVNAIFRLFTDEQVTTP